MSKKYIFETIAYIVSYANIDDSDLIASKLKFNKDGSISIYNKFLGMFSSKDLAEKRIKEYIRRDKGKYDYDNNYLGFAVTKHELNAPFSEVFDDICNFSARYIYDSYGDLFCDSELPESEERCFSGRKNPVKLSVGDIALCKCYGYDGLKAVPVLITDLPMSAAQWKRHMASNVKGDYSDDCYTVVQAKHGHFHPESVEVFPFLGKVPKKLETALQKARDKFLKGEL